MRKEVLDKHPELKNVLNMLGGRLDDETMTELNYLVDVEGNPLSKLRPSSSNHRTSYNTEMFFRSIPRQGALPSVPFLLE